ncbi:MAG: protein of unknown function DUF3552 [Siphoviridae sp. ctjeG17]|nr:MAG: protein of unknown function DUF3552 [Siphoviridae sp. ctjeG17]
MAVKKMEIKDNEDTKIEVNYTNKLVLVGVIGVVLGIICGYVQWGM